MSEPVKVERELLGDLRASVSISLTGGYLLFVLRKFLDKRHIENSNIQFTDLNNGRQVCMDAMDEIRTGFYDDMVVILIWCNNIRESNA